MGYGQGVVSVQGDGMQQFVNRQKTGISALGVVAGFIFWLLLAATFLAVAYNFYANAFPVSMAPIGDDGEHLHVAYLLGQGERPFLDFMENHPMLFNHFLWWLHEASGVASVRAWNLWSRAFVYGHFILCLLIIGVWVSFLLSQRVRGIFWLAALLLSWSLVGFYQDHFFWIWQLRADFISYAYTLLGCFLVFMVWEREGIVCWLGAIGGGLLIGFGNAILPKGAVLVIAIILALISCWMLDLRELKEYLAVARKRAIFALAAASSVSGFLFGMLLDCWLSDIAVPQWITAVFKLNSKTHQVLTIGEHNPITSVIEAFGLGLPLFGILLGSGVWQMGRIKALSAARRGGEVYLFLAACWLIVINLLLPSYSHGVTWSYNFIPTLFAAAVIYLLIINRIWLLWRDNTWSIPAQYAMLLKLALIVFLVSYALLPQTVNAFIQFSDRRGEEKLVNVIAADDYIPELVMPRDFVYLAMYPFQIPIKARHWGYYFMLVLDRDFWPHCHRLGLGPNPAGWLAAFKADPPDALVFYDQQQLLRYAVGLADCQGIAGDQFLRTVATEYTRIATRGVSFYVHNRYVTRMLDEGWYIVSEDGP